MAVLFKDFLQRLTGGAYGPQDSFNLYYWSDQYPSPKKIEYLNLNVNAGAIQSTRESDGMVLRMARDYLNNYEVCAIRKNRLVGSKAIVMKIRRKDGW